MVLGFLRRLLRPKPLIILDVGCHSGAAVQDEFFVMNGVHFPRCCARRALVATARDIGPMPATSIILVLVYINSIMVLGTDYNIM